MPKSKRIKLDRGKTNAIRTKKRKSFRLLTASKAQQRQFIARAGKQVRAEAKKVRRAGGRDVIYFRMNYEAESQKSTVVKEKRLKIRGKYFAVVKSGRKTIRKRPWNNKKGKLKTIIFDEPIKIKKQIIESALTSPIRRLSDIKKSKEEAEKLVEDMIDTLNENKVNYKTTKITITGIEITRTKVKRSRKVR